MEAGWPALLVPCSDVTLGGTASSQASKTLANQEANCPSFCTAAAHSTWQAFEHCVHYRPYPSSSSWKPRAPGTWYHLLWMEKKNNLHACSPNSRNPFNTLNCLEVMTIYSSVCTCSSYEDYLHKGNVYFPKQLCLTRICKHLRSDKYSGWHEPSSHRFSSQSTHIAFHW